MKVTKKLPMEEIIEKHEKGVKQQKLAEEYGIDRSALNRKINKYYAQIGKENPRKLKKGKTTKLRKDLPIQEITEKWKSGISMQKLAEEYGVTRSTIYDRIKKGYKESGEEKINKPGRRRIELPIEEIVEKWKCGMPPKKLSEDYNVDIGTIRRRINEYHKNSMVKNKILKNSEIITEYLQKGLSEQQIKDIAKNKKITIPDDVMNKANKEVKYKKSDMER